MISGILILAMPITVIGANFANAYEKQTFEERVISLTQTLTLTLTLSLTLTLTRRVSSRAARG